MATGVLPLKDIVSEKLGIKRELDNDGFQDSKKQKVSRTLDFGLSEYTCSGFNPIFGQLKNRMEDFLVTEVSPNRQEVRLNSLQPIDLPSEPGAENVVLANLTDDVKEKLASILSQERSVIDFPAAESKEERTSFHKAVNGYNGKLSSQTIIEDGVSIVRVKLKEQRERTGIKYPKDAKTVHFTLLKWNLSTADAVMKLSQLLRVKPNSFNYGGLKDKRGITSQRMSCRFMTARRLAGLNKSFLQKNADKAIPIQFEKNFLLGDFSYHREEMKLGDIGGNNFTIVLRDCKETTEENLENLKNSLLRTGFINYFGMQRFGNCGNTHLIGKCILKRDYEGAVKLILTPSPSQKPDIRAAVEKYTETGNAGDAVMLLRNKSNIEGLVLASLALNGSNYKQAIKSLHYKQQTLYTHAFQSYVWNRVVSRRIQRFGTRVLPGDLIEDGTPQWKSKTVQVLKEGDVCNHGLGDVIMPLPGCEVTMPSNDCAEFYKEILAEEDFPSEYLLEENSVAKEFNARGAYRAVLFTPLAFESEMLRYNEENDKLTSTDIDRVLEREFKRENEKEGDRLALKLSFSLPKSCYATMLLREVSRGRIE